MEDWLDKPDLVRLLPRARMSAGYRTLTQLAKAVLGRFGEVTSKESLRTTISNIENTKASNRETSQFLLLVEAVLKFPLNKSGKLHDRKLVEAKAAEWREEYSMRKQEIRNPIVSLKQRHKLTSKSRPEIIDERREPIHTVSYGGLVFNTMQWVGGAMLVADTVGSPESVPEQIANIEGIYGLRVSGDTMAPAIEPGAVVWINPAESPSRGYVVLAPVDITDPRRYLRLLLEVTATDFVVEQRNPVEVTTFLRSDWRCMKIVTVIHP